MIFASATDMAAAVRAGEVSAVEVVEAHLAHIHRHNPRLNAIVTLDEDGARRPTLPTRRRRVANRSARSTACR